MHALVRSVSITCLACLLFAGCASSPPAGGDDLVVISIVGTNDVHGRFAASENRGGIVTLSGYVEALRKARAEDGAVLLIDGGDMWQGTLESNLNEGALMLEAYNALGVAGAAVGNHEFDFGPVGAATIARAAGDDPQGVLRRRGVEAQFPLLAANLIDARTGEFVDWPNFQPSTLVEVAGIQVGIIGIMTMSTRATTIAPNVDDLRITPLAEAIVREARSLRRAGATLVVVAAHAGAACTAVGDPHDLSACDLDDELLAVARALPPGLVDHIHGGHEAFPIAHWVNDIPVTVNMPYTESFSRVDLVVDRSSGRIVDRELFRPQSLCPWIDAESQECSWAGGDNVRRPVYEGFPAEPAPAIVEIVERATAAAAELRNESLGVELTDTFWRRNDPESPLANLVMQALHGSVEADVSVLNVLGGLRTDLAAGELTYGELFEMFPFDNRIVMLDFTGAELRQIVAAQAQRRRRSAIAGIRAFASCDGDSMRLRILRDDGTEISDTEAVRVAANDFLALGGDRLFAPVMPPDGLSYEEDGRNVRDTVADWLRARGGSLATADFAKDAGRRWNLPNSEPATCSLQ